MTTPRFLPLEGVELRPSGTLVERALGCLAGGPMSTPELAREVLALRGNPRAAAAAVFALLGSDDRVRVDGEGTWSLVRRAETAEASLPLRLREWLVVDVETTGGSVAHGHRVIEIGMVRIAGGEVRGTFSSLVDPGRPIPRMITSLTGITGEMVAGAPTFRQLAPRIEEELTGRVFVGHNATFDWRFVATELERCSGRRLDGPQLCTLRLARRILPHLSSRSLGSLAEYFGIGMDAHHRALDDALATAHLLLRFIEWLEEREVRDWGALQEFFQTKRPARRRRRSATPRSSKVA
ncbi:MAG TPA: 3'-5' exonuclease [Longimicrobiaceae bacterium]|nr:3'-5' exonuclease [Longimicrobiaceae bacterium]